MDYSLMKELIKYLEEYQGGDASNRLEDFVIWLNNNLFSGKPDDKHAAHDELMIAFKMLYLNKELKKQTKHVLSSSKVSSIDEYSFLLHLDFQESFRKMEIIEIHNLEAPTGIEIIKRLLKNELIEEFTDQEDRRAKRIQLTKKGKKEIDILKPQIDMLFAKFTEPLSLDEKIQLSGIFDKLSQLR
ncbi:MAG: winged helix DNA-binding protein [Saprospiraceae bacterium]